jgi:hypothetical protein
MYQCGKMPARRPAVAIVQVTGGALDGSPNPCYAQQAAWAGTHLSAYIYLDGLSGPTPPLSMAGPASRCAPTSPVCRAYDFGFNWASRWLAYSRHLGFSPKLWWLDVENGSNWTSPAVNDGVIRGAADGLRLRGVTLGIYSTPYQWAAIAGSLSFPGVQIWTAGAGLHTGPGLTATAYCKSGAYNFAGGHLSMVQWGYTGDFPGAYPGLSAYDYVCSRG